MQTNTKMQEALIQHSRNLFDALHMVSNPRLHSRCDAQSLMDSCEIVKHKIQAQSMNMILDLLGVGIGQPRKPLHAYPDLQIHPPESGSCLKVCR